MEQLINKLINMGTDQFMDRSREELVMTDEIYLKDNKDEKALEKRYEALDLTTEQKMLINDYISCVKSADDRYSDISYIAGIQDAVRMFVQLDLLKNYNGAELAN